MPQRILKVADKLFPIDATVVGDRINLRFPYQRGIEWIALKNEIKAMRGARFVPEDKGGPMWTVEDCYRNHFALNYLDINAPNPYDKWKKTPYQRIEGLRRSKPGWSKINPYTLRSFQIDLISEIVAKRQFLLAADLGSGKTLVAMNVLELINPHEAWYVAPSFALTGIQSQFQPPTPRNPTAWDASYWPNFMSYNECVSRLKNWSKLGNPRSPDAIILDESTAVKTATSQRSMYIMALCEGMRAEWDNPLILLMTGTPAPKDPVDWWHQVELMCPGWIREGDIYKFRDRIGLWESREGAAGGHYPHRVTWWDDERKCAKCGQYEGADDHIATQGVHYHPWKPSVNQVAKLYVRMQGIVKVLPKSEILPELPEGIYRPVQLTPTADTKRRLRLILRGSKTAIEALSLARELSDGIRYEEIESATEKVVCPRCNGTLVMYEYEDGTPVQLPCAKCDKTGLVPKKVRNVLYTATPKDAALKALLEENEERGRIVIFSGFTASINRVLNVCQKAGWHTIRADGITKKLPHKCLASWPNPTQPPLQEFQDPTSKIDKIAFVGNPATASSSLTLTAAAMLVFYSNTFNGEHRMQAEGRIHRLGMDLNKGATYVDLIHLPTDQYVLDNLTKKKDLQALTLGELHRALASEIAED